jgi:hypothetical protein
MDGAVSEESEEEESERDEAEERSESSRTASVGKGRGCSASSAPNLFFSTTTSSKETKTK